MALAEVGARLRLQGAERYRRDAERVADATDNLADQTGRAERSLRGMERAAARAGRAVGTGFGRGVGGAVKGAGLLGRTLSTGVVGAVAGAGLVVPLLGKSLLDTATAMEGVNQKAGIVFGKALPGVTKWAAASATKMGLTTNEAVGLAAGMGDLLIPMGFAREQAAKMSAETVNLAGALSQWSGGQYAAADVAGILTDAMLGETDSLKGLGIAISADDIKARLAAKGQDKLTGARLQQASALATQQLILEKSTDAQDAYARGGARLAGLQARLRASFQSVREQLAARVAPFLATMLERLERKLPALQSALGRFANAALPRVRSGLAEFMESLRRAGGRFTGVLGQGDRAKGLGETFGGLVEMMATFAGKAVELWALLQVKMNDFIRAALGGLGQFLGGMARTFKALGALPGGVGDGFREAGRALETASKQTEALRLQLENLAAPRTTTITVKAAGVAAVASRLDRLGMVGAPQGVPVRTQPNRASAVRDRAGLPGRYNGGPMQAGRPYSVGEFGPEVVVPQVRSRVANERQARDRQLVGAGAPYQPNVFVYVGNKQLLDVVVETHEDRKARR